MSSTTAPWPPAPTIRSSAGFSWEGGMSGLSDGDGADREPRLWHGHVLMPVSPFWTARHGHEYMPMPRKSELSLTAGDPDGFDEGLGVGGDGGPVLLRDGVFGDE